MLKSRRYWIGLGVSAFFIALLLWRTPFREVMSSLRQANYAWVIPAVAVYLLSVGIRAVRWRFLLRSIRDIHPAGLFPVMMIGYMANNVLPARAGEVVRAYVLGHKYHVSKMAGFGTIAVERLFDGLTLLAMLLGAALVVGVNGVLRDLLLVTLPIFAVALCVFLFVIVSPTRSRTFASLGVRLLPHRFHDEGERLAHSFLDGLGALRGSGGLAAVVLTSGTAWLLEAVVYALMGHGFGFHLGFAYYVLAVAAGNLAITAPSSQGGVGPFEFFVRTAITFGGVGAASATAYSFAAHFVILGPATVLGLFFLWTTDLSLGSLWKRSREKEPVAEEAVAGR